MSEVLGLLAGGANILSAKSQSDAQKAQGLYQKHQNELNAKISEMEAVDAIERGDRTAGQIEAEGRQVESAQRVAYAGQGVDVRSQVAQRVTGETALRTQMDSMTAKNNAWRESWGHKFDAMNYKKAGQFAYTASKKAADATLLTGGLQAASAVMEGFFPRRSRSRD